MLPSWAVGSDTWNKVQAPLEADPVSPPAIKVRLLDIDRAKGLAIALVVAGHIVAREPPASNDWYVVLKESVYQFHMAFFMFLSGVVMGHVSGRIESFRGYGAYARRRFIRLFPAYALFGALILVGKLAFASFLHVDNSPENLWTGLSRIVVTPTESAASSLWYVYVLFAFYLLIPLGLKLAGGRLWPLLITAAVLHFVAPTEWFALNQVFEYLLFVLLGVFVASNYPRYGSVLDRYFGILLALFVVGLVAFTFALATVWSATLAVPPALAPYTKLALGLLSIPALLALVRRAPVASSQLLLAFGLYAFPIYLMNTIVIGLTKGVLLKLVGTWDGTAFLLFAPTLFALGCVGPIVAKRAILRRVAPLDHITN